MALKKTITYKNITVENAYIKAESFTGDKNELTFYMRAYKDADSSLSIENVLTSKEIKFIPDSSETSVRWDKQAYDYAKALPDYAESIDC